MKRHLEELRVGQRFTCCDLSGKLLRKGMGSAEVLIERNQEREFQTKDGKRVRIRKAHERTTWALSTVVEVGR